MTSSVPGYVSPPLTNSSSSERRPMKYQHIQPQTQAPLSSHLFPPTAMNDDLSSLFDFDSPLTMESKKPSLSKEPSFGMSDSWNMYPASPPNSAVYSNDNWRPFDQYQHVPQNILTQIDPSRSRAQYGQTTPPDDEHFDVLDSDLMMQEQDVEAISDDALSIKQGDIHSTAASTMTTMPPKRSRKGRSKAGPIDPNNPEDIRRSKFLERNRVAASKCRQKKKEWTSNLETRARDLQRENTSLRHVVDSCREEILYLKGEMLRHSTCHGGGDLPDVMQHVVQPFGSPASRHVKLESRTQSSASSRVGSPSDHAHPRQTFYQNERSSNQAKEQDRSAQSSVSDHNLERLLTSQTMHDTSDAGIAQQLRR